MNSDDSSQTTWIREDAVSGQLGLFDQTEPANDRVTTTELHPNVVLVEIGPTKPAKRTDYPSHWPVGPGIRPDAGPKLGPKACNNVARAERFEELADAMQATIDGKLSHDRQTNTPKRMGQAMSAQADGEHLRRTQQSLRALAGLHHAGTCPTILATVKSKKEVHAMMAAETLRVGNGFHDYYTDTGKPRDDASEQALALWAMLNGKTDEELNAEKLLQMERDLQFCKIPGYFQTPKALIDRMLCCAEIEPGMQVLEPSAGAGAIADAIRDSSPNIGKLETIEFNASLPIFWQRRVTA